MANILSVPETGSTNADLLNLARDGAAEGLWLRAELQTGGRGRLGRTWESPAGNLYASALVRLLPTDAAPSDLALVTAVAVHQALDGLAPGRFRIKWPNDILVDGAKLSGILLERQADAIVIGIGINVAAHPEGLDRPTTSLAALGVETDAAILLESIATRFAAWLIQWRGQGLAPIRRYWLDHAHPAGTPIAAALPDGTRLEGRFDTLDHDGALILRLENGEARAIHAGDIFLIDERT